MRITVRHVFDFGADRALVGDDLVRPEAWDALRVRTSGPFGLPADRAALEAAADARPELEERARALASLLAERGARRVVSYGAGAALLEVWLLRLAPDLELVLTDYAPLTVERLAAVFGELEVSRHDLLADAPPPADLHLFHRIDTELTNAQWRQVFARFAAVPVLVLATEIIGWRRALYEAIKRLRAPGVTSAGWIRNREAFEWLWRPTHAGPPLLVGDLHAWLLEPRRAA